MLSYPFVKLCFLAVIICIEAYTIVHQSSLVQIVITLLRIVGRSVALHCC